MSGKRRQSFAKLLGAVAVLAAAGAAAVFLVHHGSRGGVTTTTLAVPRPRHVRPHHRRRHPRAAAVLRLPARLPARELDLPILLYHRIGPVKASLPAITQRLTVAPQRFAAEMRWLVRNRFHTVTPQQAFEALEYGKPLPRRPVLITFDDGYRDVLFEAAPLLHRLHLHAIEFVITGRVDGPDPSFLTWTEIAKLQSLGVAIGSHTVLHLPLTELPVPQVVAELRDSRAALQRHLRHPVQWFAYPFGYENPRVVSLTRRAGYVLAVTTQGGTEQSARHPLLLHRDEVLDTTTVGGFAALLGG